ncbi:MAG: hypothetical protein ABEH77_07170 [Halobacteriaceae archaeon]
MGVWVEVMRAAAAANVLLLVGLSAVWARNYLQFRSKHTLGLAVFGVLLLLENGFAFYIYMLHPMLSSWFAGLPGISAGAMAVLRLLQTGAVLFLAWITLD